MALIGLEIPESILSGLREGLGDDLIAVVLFGSHTRDGSDWDFLGMGRGLTWRLLPTPGPDWSWRGEGIS